MRDARGRFTRGNTAAAAGGLARAAKLSARRRREIAAAGRAAQVEKWFLGDDQGQRRWQPALLTGPHLDVDFYAFGGSGITPVSTVTL